KIAQIGINEHSHSNQIFSSIAKQKDLFEVVGYVLPENERERIPHKLNVLDGFSELSLDEVLNDPEIEAVTIETDEIYLTKYALLAAKAGKHIHMEKPGGLLLTDFEELVSVMKEKGKVFHVGYMYRYNPFVLELIKKVKNGDLGEIISVEAQMNCSHLPKMREWLKDLPGGMTFWLGCHLVDIIYTIQGTPKKIIPINKCTEFEVSGVRDFGMVVFEYENGVSFAKSNATELGGFARRQLVVSGTKGTIELKPLERYEIGELMYTQKNEYYSNNWTDNGDCSKSTLFDRYDDMMSSFAKYVRGEVENPYTLDYELELYKILLKSCGVF
ncbi:MAG: Gfo/Idh/MocA family oxidoreductase, partial [Ruminococcaceae bacterium]|nr:Gfo/Idh/MocA family oxidoreductase [Oscillospiraceae bacterium]